MALASYTYDFDQFFPFLDLWSSSCFSKPFSFFQKLVTTGMGGIVLAGQYVQMKPGREIGTVFSVTTTTTIYIARYFQRLLLYFMLIRMDGENFGQWCESSALNPTHHRCFQHFGRNRNKEKTIEAHTSYRARPTTRCNNANDNVRKNTQYFKRPSYSATQSFGGLVHLARPVEYLTTLMEVETWTKNSYPHIQTPSKFGAFP